jgi:NDP-4-keto-2,6-dideoxyhexose 3-C-methyltransferase
MNFVKRFAMSYTAIDKCRICGNSHLIKVLDLGEQTLTGVFPKQRNQTITRGPLQLVKCVGDEHACGLLQLAHSYDLDEMYGDNYGYRSGLNASMVAHLNAKVARILTKVDLSNQPLVLDIGSNDGTTLRAYPENSCTLVGMDPTAGKFKQYYPARANVITDFFSASRFFQDFPNRKARVVTSFSMLYDLEAPLTFVQEVAQILEKDGVWVFEQSYMPLMLETNSYDTGCHEHLEYYALKQIVWMLDRCQLKIVDVEFNGVNGGSFSVMATRKDSTLPVYSELAQLLDKEKYLDDMGTYLAFEKRVVSSKASLLAFIAKAKSEGKRVAALGASTKGNVLLQYCGLTANELESVGEVNPDKFGTWTPGSLIPIIDEKLLLADEPDYLIVLPWHFKPFFEQKYQLKKAKLVFPLPDLHVL